MLGDVREGLGRDEVRGGLDLRLQAVDRRVDGDRHRSLPGQRAERDGEAALGQDPGVDPAGELSQLLDGDLYLLGRVREQAIDCRVAVPVESALGALQLEG